MAYCVKQYFLINSILSLAIKNWFVKFTKIMKRFSGNYQNGSQISVYGLLIWTLSRLWLSLHNARISKSEVINFLKNDNLKENK